MAGMHYTISHDVQALQEELVVHLRQSHLRGSVPPATRDREAWRIEC
jgi:hypothetical protein